MSSKIKVDTIENVAGSGNVSLGSGHNLVVPGNQTVGGTLGVTGATTTTGITSSAAHTVTTSTHANASVFKTTGHTQIMLQDTDATANDQFWGLQNSGGAFNILTCNDDRASGFVTPMTIDSAGRVNLYNQPSFRVGGNNANWVSVTSGNTAIIEFDGNVYHNVGSHYSTANDRFTAPIAGRYLIGYHAYVRNNAASSDGTSAYGYVRLKKNGNNLSYLNNIFGYANHTDNDIQMNLQTVIELAANDYMQVALSAVGGTVQHYGNSSQFYGHLLS